MIMDIIFSSSGEGRIDIRITDIKIRIDRRILIMRDIPVTVEPLFIRHQDIQSSNVTALDICHACTRNGGTGQLEGVQRVNNLWRIYLKSRSARLELFLRKTILINGEQVPLYEQNPFVI